MKLHTQTLILILILCIPLWGYSSIEKPENCTTQEQSVSALSHRARIIPNKRKPRGLFSREEDEAPHNIIKKKIRQKSKLCPEIQKYKKRKIEEKERANELETVLIQEKMKEEQTHRIKIAQEGIAIIMSSSEFLKYSPEAKSAAESEYNKIMSHINHHRKNPEAVELYIKQLESFNRTYQDIVNNPYKELIEIQGYMKEIDLEKEKAKKITFSDPIANTEAQLAIREEYLTILKNIENNLPSLKTALDKLKKFNVTHEANKATPIEDAAAPVSTK